MPADPSTGGVLCIADGRDHSLEWLRSSVPGLVVVEAGELGDSAALTLEQQWPTDGGSQASRAELRLGDRVFDVARRFESVYCRVPLMGVDHLAFDADDAQYAAAEWNALLIGWLEVLGDRVVNRPLPHGLAGRWACVESWSAMAAGVGIHTVTGDPNSSRSPMHQRDDVVVVGGRVFSDFAMHHDHVDGVRALARSVGARIIGFSAVAGWDGGPLVDLSGNPCPTLTSIGRAGGEAVRAVLGPHEPERSAA